MKNGKKMLSMVLCLIMTIGTIAIGGDGIAELLDNIIIKASASNNYSVGDIIEFGSYPQSKVTNTDLINELYKTTVYPKTYNYYSGTGDLADGNMSRSDYMQYCDVEYPSGSGDWYRGVIFSQYRPRYTGYISDAENSYQDDNGYETYVEYWFKYEPIKWRILDPYSGLVICDSIIDSQAFNDYLLYDEDIDEYYGNENKTSFASNYCDSSINSWLNSSFIYSAFSQEEQYDIVFSTINNDGVYTLSGNTGFEMYDSPSLTVKLFLLSFDEALNSEYGFSTTASVGDSRRLAVGSDYAKCQGLWVKNGFSCWHLRTAGRFSHHTCYVSEEGKVGADYYPSRTNYGIRPAMRIRSITDSEDLSQYPNDYSFLEDRYQFKNFNESIDKKYYTEIFGTIKGEALYNNKPDLGQGGNCFGMAISTIATLCNAPRVTDYVSSNGSKYTTLNSIKEGTSNVDIGMTAKEYIKCCFVYQRSYENILQRHTESFKGIKNVYNAVVNNLNSSKTTGIAIDLWGGPGAHTVYACGVLDNNVLIDDSNSETQTILEINGDEWRYSGGSYTWSSASGCSINYVTSYMVPYLTIKSSVEPSSVYLYDGTLVTGYTEETETDGSFNLWSQTIDSKIDSGKCLAVVSEEDYEISNISNMYKIISTGGLEENSTNTYWLKDGANSISAKNISNMSSKIELISDELAISSNLPSEATAFIDVGDNNSIDIQCNKNDNIEISFITESFDKNLVSLTISGTAINEEISASSKGDLIEVSGISNGIVTLKVDDEILSEQSFENKEDEIIIFYDSDGVNNSLELSSNTFTIIYNVDGIKYDEKAYEYGADVIKLITPQKQGYEFSGWDNEEPDTMPAENLVLNGTFNPITYYASFMADGIQVAKIPFTVENMSITAPAVPKKDGYTGKWSTYTLTANDITIKALYTEIPNPTAKAKLKTPANTEVEYAATVTVAAKATGVPKGYYVALYDGKTLLKKGSNTEVSYTFPGEFTSTKNITVKIIDSKGNVQKDANGKNLTGTVEIKAKTGFFDKFIAFFKRLFKTLPAVTVEPK